MVSTFAEEISDILSDVHCENNDEITDKQKFIVQSRLSPDYSRRRWVWREPMSGRRIWLSTPIRALGAPTHRDGRYAYPAQPVTGW
jgi:hypothetical protein